MKETGKHQKMKKTFVTVISQQPTKIIKTPSGAEEIETKLNAAVYASPDNEKLRYEKATRFPIMTAINGYVEKGDSVKVIAIRNTADTNLMNIYERLFLPELKDLCASKEISDLELVTVDSNEYIGIRENHELFEKLIASIEDNERLCACMTYGVKPVTVILFAGLHYAYNTKDNVYVDCVLYGNVNRNGQVEEYEIRDMTPLFYESALFNRMAHLGFKDPLSRTRGLLSEIKDID